MIEFSTKLYFGIVAIIFTLQWLYVMFGTFRKREPKIDCINELNRFIEEIFSSECEGYLFIQIIFVSLIWPISLLVVVFWFIYVALVALTRTTINKRMKKNNENKLEE